MSRAEENRKRIQTVEIALPSGNTYQVRRPLFEEIQALNAMPTPGEHPEAEPEPVVDEHKPDFVVKAEAADAGPTMDRLFTFMAAVSLDPVIVVTGEVTDPATQVSRREVELAGDHETFMDALTQAFFGPEAKAKQPFRKVDGVDD